MRKKLFIAIILIILILSPIKVQATNENIIETQSEELNLDNFINETENIVGEDINLEKCTLCRNCLKNENIKIFLDDNNYYFIIEPVGY